MWAMIVQRVGSPQMQAKTRSSSAVEGVEVAVIEEQRLATEVRLQAAAEEARLAQMMQDEVEAALVLPMEGVVEAQEKREVSASGLVFGMLVAPAASFLWAAAVPFHLSF